MQKWEYATVPLLVHATKQILDNWGEDGWELVAVVPGPNPEQLVAYLKRPEGVSRDRTARQRLAELGLTLPRSCRRWPRTCPAVRSGDQVYVSGQLPMADGKLLATGKVGRRGDSAEQAKELAARCALNALAAIDALVGLESVVQIVKVTGFVASAPGFTGQPGVVNGASELFGEVFGEAGRHARSAVGVAELPLGAPVEVEVIVEVLPEPGPSNGRSGEA